MKSTIVLGIGDLVGLLFRKQTEDGRESNTATEAERYFPDSR